jgi:hypothetical protein
MTEHVKSTGKRKLCTKTCPVNRIGRGFGDLDSDGKITSQRYENRVLSSSNWLGIGKFLNKIFRFRVHGKQNISSPDRELYVYTFQNTRNVTLTF